MNLLFLIICTVGAIIAAVEFFRLKRDLIGGLVLTAIAFIYVGFAGNNLTAILIEGGQAILFLLIAYFGITKYKSLIGFGLITHGLWDLLHLLSIKNISLPEGYEIFCIGVDTILGLYFSLKINTKKFEK